MGFAQWIRNHVPLIRQRPETVRASHEMDELNQVKRTMARFSDDLQAGRIQDQHKILRVQTGDYLEDDLFGPLRKDAP